MKKIKSLKHFVMATAIFVSTSFVPIKPAKADLWGGDVIVLTKILANAIQQLMQLQQVVGTARNNLQLVRDINRGLTDIMSLVRTAYPNSELGLYKDWDSLQSALQKAEAIYGHAANSKEALAQGHLDRSIVEAILMYNSINKHSKQIDRIGEDIKSQSLRASPKGAQKLTAQGMGVSLHVQNESLRTQSALLKLEAQNSAIQNKKDKDETRFFLNSSRKLKQNMQEYKPQFKTPRF